MFSSPSIRLYTSENVDNLVQRKLGNNFLSRKPFVDRSVNSKTPEIGKRLKPKPNLKKEIGTVEKVKSPKANLNAEDYMFSYKEVADTYDDIWPTSQCFNKDTIIKILRKYCGIEHTPPASPKHTSFDMNPVFFDEPEPKMQVSNDTFLPVDIDFWNNSSDVEVPNLDYDELDITGQFIK